MIKKYSFNSDKENYNEESVYYNKLPVLTPKIRLARVKRFLSNE